MSSILIFHLASATLLTLSMIGLLVLGILRKRQPAVVALSRTSFVATLGTGTVLVIVSPASLTHLCIMMTGYSLGVFGLEALYQKRTKSALHTSASDI
jgi:hypothetical protein